MRRFASLLLALAAVALTAAAAAQPALAQERHAVVVGAQDYPDAIGALPGALADARLVAAALQSEGYTVELLENPAENELVRAAYELAVRAEEGGEDAMAVFYFVGHGVQINGDTFLVPIDARLADDLALSSSSLSANQFASRLYSSNEGHSFIVLDAGNGNQLTSRFALAPGLAPIDSPARSVVIFSNNPGEVALPRQPGVSIFAEAFANFVVNPSSSLDQALSQLREEVRERSGDARYVWASVGVGASSALGGGNPPAAAAPPPAGVADDTRGLAAPTPVPSAPAAPTRSLGGGAAAEVAADAEAAAEPGQIHYVEVFFGTDRDIEVRRNGDIEFRSTTADELTYGIAEVSIPPKHEAGQLESPRWWRLEFSPNPERHVVYQDQEFLEEDEFFTQLRETVQESDGKQAFVFIHGFNTAFEDAARRTAQMHHDLGFDGAPIFYSWPSEGRANPLAYVRDTNAADRTVPKLEQFLMDVAERTGAEQVHLIAHSMGNRALVGALDEIAETMAIEGRESPFNQIILSAPDIDVDVFRDIAEEILPTGERMTLYASANDQALQVSRQYNGNPRAGDASDGIVIVQGLNTIDASEVHTELFDIGHDYFATDASIIEDVAKMIATNADPTTRGLEPRHLPDVAEEYWVILREMFGG